MKYEAPVAVVVDFENDYVVAAPSTGRIENVRVMVDPEEPCFPCHGSSPHGVFCSVSRAVYIYTLLERRTLP